MCIYYLFLFACPPLFFLFFFFNDTATTEIYTLSLHDALPILNSGEDAQCLRKLDARGQELFECDPRILSTPGYSRIRSEEHTSELQSHLNLVCRLLLEKKKKRLNTKGIVSSYTLHYVIVRSTY